MKNEIIKFSVTDVAIKELAVKYQNMAITDTASYKAVVSGIGEIRSIRVSVEKRRKELKADALEYGRRLDSEAKRITALLWPIEDNLKNLKQATDDEKALAKAEEDRLEKERIGSIQSRIAAFPPDVSKLPQLLKMTAPEIQEMQDVLAAIEIDIEDYQEFTPEAIKAKEEKKKLLQEYYIARITADAETAKQKAEAERQEQIRKDQELETERQKKEQEAQAEKYRIAQAEIEAQKKAIYRLEDEKIEHERIEQERLAQIERDRLAKIEAEKQEKARAEQEAKEEAARIKAEDEEKTRQETLRPDRENLLLYLDTLTENINSTVEPVIKTSEGKVVFSAFKTDLAKTFTDIRQTITDI